MQNTPTGLKIINILSYLACAQVLIGLFMYPSTLSPILAVAFLGYLFLIIAIHKRNKVLFIVATTIFCLFTLLSIVLVFVNYQPHTAIRVLIEISLITYLMQERKYFNA